MTSWHRSLRYQTYSGDTARDVFYDMADNVVPPSSDHIYSPEVGSAVPRHPALIHYRTLVQVLILNSHLSV